MLRTLNLTKRYGRAYAVRDLCLSVRPGEIYGFLGRNGAGKTTTIRMIMGVVPPTSGSFELFEQEVRRPSKAHKRRMGYVSQTQHFYPWMSAERLGRFVASFYPRWDAARYQELIRRFDIPAERRVSLLSGGTRVKVALALALAHRPELLVLDEPTSGLDPAARRELMNLIVEQSEQEGHATFFSSHIVEEVERVADRVGILDGGELCFEGRLGTLTSRYRQLPAEEIQELPPGFRALGTDVTRQGRLTTLVADPEAWASSPPGLAGARPLSLEGSFLALVLDRARGSAL